MTACSSVRPISLQLFLLTCLLLVPGIALAQSTADYCEPSPVIKAELKKVAKVHEEELPFTARLQKQKTMLQQLLSKHPNDFHLQKRYQDSRRSGFYYDIDAMLVDYRAQMEKKPTDPVAVYLYARLLVGRQTKETIALAELRRCFTRTRSCGAQLRSRTISTIPARSSPGSRCLFRRCPSEILKLGRS